MKGKIRALIKKDVLDVLRDPKVYLGFLLPLIIFAAFGAISQATAPPSYAPLRVYVEGKWGLLTSYLKSYGINITSVPQGADAIISFRNASGFMELNVTFLMKDVNQLYYAKAEELNYIMDRLIPYYRDYLLNRSGLQNYMIIENPANLSFTTVLNSAVYPFNPLYIFEMSQVEELVAPTILFALSIEVAEMSATLITVEQEEKTLEVLLSMPVRRWEILTSKMISALIISVLSSLFYIIGLFVFSTEYMAFFGLQGYLAPEFETSVLIVFILLLIMSTVFASSLGLLVGLISKDLRVANIYLGIITVPILIPTLFFIAGGSLSYVSGPLKYVLLALPPTYAIDVTRAFITRVLPPYWGMGVLVSVIETSIIIYAAMLTISGKKVKLPHHKKG